MSDLPKNGVNRTDQGPSKVVDKGDMPVEETDQRRRELLNMIKNVAIASPILLTLKNTPAFAQTPSADASATHGSHAGGVNG